LDGVLGKQEETVEGDLILECTTNYDILSQEDNEVMVAVKVKEVGIKNREAKALIDQNKIAEASEIQSALLTELKEFESRDSSGRITKLIGMVNNGIQALAKGGMVNNGIQSLPQGKPSNQGGKLIPPQRAFTKKKVCDSADWSAMSVKNTLKSKQNHGTNYARKYFDSADWSAKKDSTHAWKADDAEDSDSWSSDDEI